MWKLKYQQFANYMEKIQTSQGNKFEAKFVALE
jgi:hypothetical protein